MSRSIFLTAWVALLTCAVALGDQISLKNGDRMSGTIVKSDGKILLLHTEYAGDVTLKWDAVQGLQSAEELHIELHDGKSAVGIVATSGDKLEISTKAGTVEAAPSSIKVLRNDAEQEAYEKTLHPGPLQGWKPGLNVGFALTGGNSQTRNLALAFIATRQTLRDKTGLYTNAVYARDDTGGIKTTTANTIGGGFRYDHDITKKIFGFAAADFFSDALQGLNLRSVVGGGAGLHAVKTERSTIDLLGGLNYTRESYTTFSRNLVALTIGEEFMHKIGKTTALNQRLYIFPDINSAGDYRGTFDFGTVTKMSKWLGWQNSFTDVYVTNPPALKKRNDLIFTTGLNISFVQ